MLNNKMLLYQVMPQMYVWVQVNKYICVCMCLYRLVQHSLVFLYCIGLVYSRIKDCYYFFKYKVLTDCRNPAEDKGKFYFYT